MEKKYDIIGLATPGQDLVIELEKMPREVSSKMYDCCFQGGGWVATALCAAGNLGMRASFCGVIGDDIFGRMIHICGQNSTILMHGNESSSRDRIFITCPKLRADIQKKSKNFVNMFRKSNLKPFKEKKHALYIERNP